MKTNKGITLIALIITVIILLILAGTAIAISINGGNIFEKAQNAVTQYNGKVEEEENRINAIWNTIKNENEEEPVIIPEGLTIGSAVTYEPAGGTFDWDRQYFASSGDAVVTLDSTISGSERVTNWKVFNINETTR